MISYSGKTTTHTAGLLKNLIIKENLDEVRIDDSSVANGVTDILLENTALRKKVVPITTGPLNGVCLEIPLFLSFRQSLSRNLLEISNGFPLTACRNDKFGQTLIRNHEVQLTDDDCWRAQWLESKWNTLLMAS